MSFENLLEGDLTQLLQAGASFSLSARARPHQQLLRLAAAAVEGNGHLRLTQIMPRMTNDLVEVARAGRGHVTFE
jgi:hypothetical protein